MGPTSMDNISLNHHNSYCDESSHHHHHHHHHSHHQSSMIPIHPTNLKYTPVSTIESTLNGSPVYQYLISLKMNQQSPPLPPPQQQSPPPPPSQQITYNSQIQQSLKQQQYNTNVFKNNFSQSEINEIRNFYQLNAVQPYQLPNIALQSSSDTPQSSNYNVTPIWFTNLKNNNSNNNFDQGQQVQQYVNNNNINNNNNNNNSSNNGNFSSGSFLQYPVTELKRKSNLKANSIAFSQQDIQSPLFIMGGAQSNSAVQGGDEDLSHLYKKYKVNSSNSSSYENDSYQSSYDSTSVVPTNPKLYSTPYLSGAGAFNDIQSSIEAANILLSKLSAIPNGNAQASDQCASYGYLPAHPQNIMVSNSPVLSSSNSSSNNVSPTPSVPSSPEIYSSSSSISSILSSTDRLPTMSTFYSGLIPSHSTPSSSLPTPMSSLSLPILSSSSGALINSVPAAAVAAQCCCQTKSIKSGVDKSCAVDSEQLCVPLSLFDEWLLDEGNLHDITYIKSGGKVIGAHADRKTLNLKAEYEKPKSNVRKSKRELLWTQKYVCSRSGSPVPINSASKDSPPPPHMLSSSHSLPLLSTSSEPASASEINKMSSRRKKISSKKCGCQSKIVISVYADDKIYAVVRKISDHSAHMSQTEQDYIREKQSEVYKKYCLIHNTNNTNNNNNNSHSNNPILKCQ